MTACLGEAFNLSSLIDEAVTMYEWAWRFAESKRIFAHGPRVLALLGDAYGRAGRYDEALRSAQRALDQARALNPKGPEIAGLQEQISAP